MVAVIGEHDRNACRVRSAVFAKAKKAYDKAVRTSEALRAKDEHRAQGDKLVAPRPSHP
jgi:hypothetical protein